VIEVEKQPNAARLPLILVFVLIAGLLAISLYNLYGAVLASVRGDLEEAVYSGLLGAIGIGISLYMSFMIGKRRFSQKPLPQIVTTVECRKCGFKSLNKFEKDDYVFKTIGNCQKCNEPMLITAIYVEETKKK